MDQIDIDIGSLGELFTAHGKLRATFLQFASYAEDFMRQQAEVKGLLSSAMRLRTGSSAATSEKFWNVVSYSTRSPGNHKGKSSLGVCTLSNLPDGRLWRRFCSRATVR